MLHCNLLIGQDHEHCSYLTICTIYVHEYDLFHTLASSETWERFKRKMANGLKAGAGREVRGVGVFRDVGNKQKTICVHLLNYFSNTYSMVQFYIHSTKGSWLWLWPSTKFNSFSCVCVYSKVRSSCTVGIINERGHRLTPHQLKPKPVLFGETEAQRARLYLADQTLYP